MTQAQKHIFIILIILSLFPLIGIKYPPLTDYPNHLLVIEILKKYNDSSSIFSQYLEKHFTFAPGYSLHYAIMWLCSLFIPTLTVGKIFLIIYVIALPFSFYYLLRSLPYYNIAALFFVFFLIYTWSFNMGFIGYCLSIPIYCYSLGFWIRYENNLKFKKWLILTLLSIIIFLFHLISWCAFVWSVILFSFLRSKSISGFIKKTFFLGPSFAIFFMFLIQQGFLENKSPQFDFNLYHKIKEFIAYTSYSFSLIEVSVIFLPLILFSILLIYSGYKILKNQNLFINRHFLYLFLSFSLFFVLIPITFFGMWPANARLSPFIIIAGLCSCIPLKRSQNKKLIIVIIPFIIISVLVTTFYYKKLDGKLSEFVSGICGIPVNKKVLPIIVDYKGSSNHTTPFLNAWAYYHILKGGIGPYFFAYPYLRKDITPIRYKNRKNLPNFGLFNAEDKDFSNMERIIINYDCLLIWGSTKKLEDYLKIEVQNNKLKKIYENKIIKILEVLHNQ